MGLGSAIYSTKINTWWLDSNFMVFLLLHVRLIISLAPSWLLAKLDIPHPPAPRGRRISGKKHKKRKNVLETLKQFIELLYTRLTISTPPPNTNIVAPHKSHSPSHTSGAAAPRAALQHRSPRPRSPPCLPVHPAMAV